VIRIAKIAEIAKQQFTSREWHFLTMPSGLVMVSKPE
jgi:hypothetical protein